MRIFTKEKQTRKQFLNHYLFVLMFSLLLLGIGYLLEKKYEISSTLPNYKKVQNTVIKKETDTRKTINKIKELIPLHRLATIDSTLRLTENKTVSYFLFKKDSLIYWNNTQTDIGEKSRDELMKNNFHELNNSYCISISDTLSDYTIIALINIKNNYPYENDYIKNEFCEEFGLDKHIQITTRKDTNAFRIYSSDKVYLFSLTDNQQFIPNEKYKTISILLYLCGFLLLFFFLSRFGKTIKIARKASILPLISAGISTFIVFCCLWWDVPRVLFNSNLFSPVYYASGTLLSSLGHLLIASVFLLWQAFALQKVKLSFNSTHKSLSVLISVFTQLVSITMFFYLLSLLKNIVYNSGVEIFIQHLQDISFACVILLLLPFSWIVSFVLLRKVITHHLFGQQSLKTVSILNASVSVSAILYMLIASEKESLFFPLYYFIFCFIFDYLFQKKESIFDFKKITLLSLLSAIIIGWQLITYSIEKKKEKFRTIAENMATGQLPERDIFAEILFDELQNNVYTDLTQTNITLFSQKESETISGYILQKYFRGYWNRYNISAFVHHKNASSPSEQALVDKYKHIVSKSEQIKNSRLYYCKDVSTNIDYLGVFDTPQISYYFEFQSKLTSSSYSYPDLLLEAGQKRNLQDNVSIARYENDKLVSFSGRKTPPKEKYWTTKNTQEHFTVYTDEKFTLYILQVSPAEQIVVRERTSRYISSPIFIFYLFLIYLLLGTFGLWIAAWKRKTVKPYYGFLSKLQISFTILLIISFLTIFFITVNLMVQQYKRQQNTELRNKGLYIQKSISDAVKKGLLLTENNSSELNFFLQDLSETYKTDIHLYNAKGELIASSQPVIFSKGLLGKLISPTAFFDKESNHSQLESIGKWEYLSAYNTLKNDKDELLGYIAVPSFFSSDTINRQIFNLLGVMINVYLLIIILAVMISIFINKELAKPIKLLQEKLQQIGLTGKNEKITYSKNDEIAQLVHQYNLMVDKLAESAELLAKSERESAWKQMARQIAHEINNPLTPMKLTIQQLQRTQKSEHFGEYFEKSSRLLIEQIDNLSRIATAFSNFAKMPDAKKEMVTINSPLQSVIELFRHNNESVHISYSTDNIAATVWADKEQLTQVFNNVLKNAIQAIPAERKGEINIQLTETETQVRVTIQDNGCGIPDDIRDKLFIPNFTTKSSGMGLGLAIVNNIVESSGGKIWFETQLNEGSTFFVEFPKR
jgi:signal transduction histidine kinase